MFYALALAYDPAHRRVDLAGIDPATGSLMIDATAATPLLVAIGTDGRAEPDDTLPDGVTEGTLAAGFVQRRGWAGDRLVEDGTRVGSRLWLLARAKLGDRASDAAVQTQLLAEGYASQATADFEERYGAEVTVAASRVDRNAMLLQVQASGQVLQVSGLAA